MRRHTLPEKRPGESNEDWCRRAAESIPADELLRLLAAHLMRRRGWAWSWSFISRFTGHGSGVSAAILRRFLPPDDGGES